LDGAPGVPHGAAPTSVTVNWIVTVLPLGASEGVTVLVMARSQKIPIANGVVRIGEFGNGWDAAGDGSNAVFVAAYADGAGMKPLVMKMQIRRKSRPVRILPDENKRRLNGCRAFA